MQIHDRDLNWYLERLRHGPPFALAGYSDAEWHCVLGQRQGERTGLGQVLSAAHGKKLLDVLRRRQGCYSLGPGRERIDTVTCENRGDFLFAVPKCLRVMPGFDDGRIDWFLGRQDIWIEANERDMITDDLAAAAGLHPLIERLQEMPCIMVGNAELEPHLRFLGLRRFIGIESPNLHLTENGIEKAAVRAARYDRPAVYLVSAGVSAACIIDIIWERCKPGSYAIDTGSIWDAFAGIGGQRKWRRVLYACPQAWAQWKRRCIHGVD